MQGYTDNIETLTRENSHFRHVLFTSSHTQLVVMSLKPGEDIGEEVHADVDQFFRVESGAGVMIMNGEETTVADGDVVIVPAGAQHNLINTSSDTPLQLYTLYSPPHHKDGTIHRTKEEAEMDSEDHV